MDARVVLSPGALKPADVLGRTVVVFDVMRATSTMTAAFSSGVEDIRVFDNIESARQAAAAYPGRKLLCGEVNCLPPAGFDLGNSPRDWLSANRSGYRVFMSTTNGTRAIAAAAPPKPFRLLVAALVNAKAAAAAVAALNRDVTLLCSGTAGGDSVEDMIGAGAVLHALNATGDNPGAHLALSLYKTAATNIPQAFRQTAAGRNLLAAGLEADIDACAGENSLSVVGSVEQDPFGLACRPLRF
jgi:2-phosphosulfolactate phosphatase